MPILSRFAFQFPHPAWEDPPTRPAVQPVGDALRLQPLAGAGVRLHGPGVHTRNGDALKLTFTPALRRGTVTLGFRGGMESAVLSLDLVTGAAELHTSEWNRPQPVARVAGSGRGRSRTGPKARRVNTLTLHKAADGDGLVAPARIRAALNGVDLLAAGGLDLLPEMGVTVGVTDASVTLHELAHSGSACTVPEYLHVGGWQVLNRPDIETNLAALERGVAIAAEAGVQLLVTPETSLTGLFPDGRVTHDPGPIAAAERRLRRAIQSIPGAPYVVVGLPVWETGADGHRVRLNASRLYDPDGHVAATCCKIHSCEHDFWHGRRLHELDVHGVPCSLHVCHDGRYPETWTLPVMFGARLLLHPSNGGAVHGSVDAFESSASRATTTSHAFYVRVNGGGGSCIVGPQKFDNVLAVSPECRRDNRAFPMVGAPVEGLLAARIRVHDAFGYWPVRSLRAGPEVAAAQLALYRAQGGRRGPAAA